MQKNFDLQIMSPPKQSICKTKIIRKTMIQNAKPKSRSVFDLFKSLFYTKGKVYQSKAQDTEQHDIKNRQNEQKLHTVDFNKKSVLSKPYLHSSILQVQYLNDALSWKQILDDGFFFGMISNPKISDVQKSGEQFWVQISKTSQLNSMSCMRAYCFDLIFSGSHDEAMLKQIFKSQQRVLLRVQNDEELRQVIKRWQQVIEKENSRRSITLRSSLHKLSVKIRILNGEYIILLNENEEQKLQRMLEQFNILSDSKQDHLIMQRMRDTLTFKEYFQLKDLKKQGNLQRHILVRFLLDRYLISQDQLILESPLIGALSPKMSNERYLSNITTPQKVGSEQQKLTQLEIEIENIKKMPSLIYNASEEEQNLFNLHLLDRYEGIQDEEDRTLNFGNPQKTKRYRTRSCCLQSFQHQGQLITAFQFQNFVLDI